MSLRMSVFLLVLTLLRNGRCSSMELTNSPSGGLLRHSACYATMRAPGTDSTLTLLLGDRCSSSSREIRTPKHWQPPAWPKNSTPQLTNSSPDLRQRGDLTSTASSGKGSSHSMGSICAKSRQTSLANMLCSGTMTWWHNATSASKASWLGFKSWPHLDGIAALSGRFSTKRTLLTLWGESASYCIVERKGAHDARCWFFGDSQVKTC